MKKHMKKWLCLMMVLCMVCSMAACGKSESQNVDKQSENETNATESEDKNTGNKEETEAGNVDEDEGKTDKYVFTLPLTEEPEELSIWWVWSDPSGKKETLAEQPGQAAMMEETNVQINYINVMSAEASEKFGLMLASGDLPDMIREEAGTASYPGGMDRAVEDGVYLELNDLYEKYMPHYKALRESNETVRKDTITDSGKIVGIYSLRCDDTGTICEELPWLGFFVRGDWMDEAGLDTPVTIADWEEMLTVFKNDFGSDAPLMLGSGGWFTYDAFLSAFGVTHDFYQEDGVVKFGPAEEGYIEYLQLMNDWYNKGLIDPNFTANDAAFWTYFPEYFGPGRTGVVQIAYAWAGTYCYDNGFSTDPDFYLEAVNYPVLNEGDVSPTRCDAGMIVQKPVAISTSCKNPELAAKWLDYTFTMDAMKYQCYGVEGETYYVDENGAFAYTDLIMKNPDGTDPGAALNSNTLSDGVGIISWESVHKISDDPYTVESKAIWAKDSTSIMMPQKITMTAEEAAEINIDVTTLKTARDEASVKVIMGNMSIDEYRDVVEGYYNNMNLERCIEVYQTALDRYNNR